MSAPKPAASRRFLPQEVIISEITADDAKSVVRITLLIEVVHDQTLNPSP